MMRGKIIVPALPNEMSLRFLKPKQKDKFFLVLDIGTEAIKALIFKREQLAKKDNKKIIVLGASQQYFEKSGVFDSRDFEEEVLKKTISKAIKETQEQAGIRTTLTLLSLPATILKGRIVFQFFERKKAKEEISEVEEKIIYDQVLRNVQKEISQKFAEEFGILPQDIQGISLKFLGRKIDGYAVSTFQGYKGKILEFKILSAFLAKNYLENIKKIIEDLGLGILNPVRDSGNKAKDQKEDISNRVKIIYPPENLPFTFFPEKVKGLPVIQGIKKDVIFLDVGGEVTQIFLVKDGNLERINEFGMGGKIFSQSLSNTLGINEERARDLKERYSNKLLSPEIRERIKEILAGEQRDWYEGLKSGIKEMKIEGLFPSTVFFFGGGSQLPEIQDSLRKMGSKIKFIFPKDFKNIEDRTESLKTPQYTPTLLTINNEEIF